MSESNESEKPIVVERPAKLPKPTVAQLYFDRHPAPARSREEWAAFLHDVANGEHTITEAMALHSVGPTTLIVKQNGDPEFRQALRAAMAECVTGHALNARKVIAGAEGYTTGSEKRDLALAKHDREMAKLLAPDLFREKVEIDQRQIVLNITQNDTDW